jgi:hypothetical protein
MDPILNANAVAERQGWFIVGAYRRAATPRWGTSVPTAICLMSRLGTDPSPVGNWRVAEIRADSDEFGEGWYSGHDDRLGAFKRWIESVRRAEQDIAIYYDDKPEVTR